MNLFPFKEIRPEQSNLLVDIRDAIKNKKHIIAHAPTGLGKTVAALTPAIEYALENKLTVFFLTSRNTQHNLVIDTLREICKKKKITAVDFVGKKGMCPPLRYYDAKTINFIEFCKRRKEGNCESFTKTFTKGDYTAAADAFVDKLDKEGPFNVEDVVTKCEETFCAHELSFRLAQKAQVIVADYYHLFSPKVRKLFLKKTMKDLKKSIVIVDEAHNLPDRVRNLLTHQINTLAITQLATDLKDVQIKTVLHSISSQMYNAEEKLAPFGEVILKKQEFIDLVERAAECKYSELIKELEKINDEVEDPDEEEDLAKFIDFLRNWLGEEKGFARILRQEKTRGGRTFISLEYNCLHPGTLSSSLFSSVHSAILMSGTLVPTEMYRDILGLNKETILKAYANPFPKENRCILISKEMTTKFDDRTDVMFRKIAAACAQVINNVNGNSAVFFSSYDTLRSTMRYLENIANKQLFVESKGMTKEERSQLLANFKMNLMNGGGAIIGVQGANFSEGIDLPGELLTAVVVVGLPFAPPDLRQKAIMDYYEDNFGRGWDYGYIFPAINKSLQAAGRCIRSETDRGLIVLLDKRFAWSKYSQIIPPDWTVKITDDFSGEVTEFFKK